MLTWEYSKIMREREREREQHIIYATIASQVAE